MGKPIGKSGVISYRRAASDVFTLLIDQGATGGNVTIGMIGGPYTLEWRSLVDPLLTGAAASGGGNINFTVPIGGQYILELVGGFTRPNAAGVGQAQRNKILEVVSWGDTQIWGNSFNNGFRLCLNLTKIAHNWPLNVTSAQQCFRQTGLLQIPGRANMENIQLANAMFRDSALQSIGSSTRQFANVTAANAMFRGTQLQFARQPFNSVLDSRSMFRNCDQLINADGVELSNATNARFTFQGCAILEAIPSTVLFLQATNIRDAFDECPNIDPASYDSFLIRHNAVAAALNPGTTVGANQVNYTSAGEPARTALEGPPANWNFLDDGLL